MPASPTAAARGEPANGGNAARVPNVRAQPAQDRLPRPGEKRARKEEEDDDITEVIVKAGAGAQQRAPAQSPQTGAGGSRMLPEAFRPTPDEAMEDVPVAVQEGGVAVMGRGVRVMDTEGCGGRGLGRTPTELREPNNGR